MTRAATPKRAPAARTRSGGTSGPWRTEPARQQLVREHNLALVLSHILEPKAPVTRAQIAQATGLTRATVSDLVESLVRGHMVTELAPRAAVGAGRPGVPLAPASGTIVGIGAEVAVDWLGVTAIDLSGRAVNQRVVERDLRGSDPQRTLARLWAPSSRPPRSPARRSSPTTASSPTRRTSTTTSPTTTSRSVSSRARPSSTA